VPLDALWGRHRTSLLRERLLEGECPDAQLDALEATLLEVWRPQGPHEAVAFALRAFERAPLATRAFLLQL